MPQPEPVPWSKYSSPLFFFCIVGGVVYWIITLLPLPEPFKQIAMVCMLLIFLLVILSIFLGGGSGLLHFPVR